MTTASRSIVLSVAIAVTFAIPAAGQDLVSAPLAVRIDASTLARSVTPQPPIIVSAPVAARIEAPTLAGSVTPQPPIILTGRAVDAPVVVPAKRPAALISLYAVAGGLQVMDLYTTSRGLKAGAYETNPGIRNGNVGTAIALKAATTGLGILIAEKVWRKNKLGAVLGMVAANVITTAAVINNYGVIRKLEGR